MLRRIALVAVVGAVLLGAGGCGGPTVSPAATSPPSIPSPLTPPAPDGDLPPEAGLLVPDGDPVLGQVGTFIWRDAGSDAPWLPGTPVSVELGQPVEFGLSAPVPVEGWRARFAPAGDRNPTRFESLGERSGAIRFPSLPAGHWTVELIVTFGDGLGEAAYYWQVDVE